MRSEQLLVMLFGQFRSFSALVTPGAGGPVVRLCGTGHDGKSVTLGPCDVRTLLAAIADGRKACCRCRRVLDAGQFGKDGSRKCGLSPRCRSCEKARLSKYPHRGRRKVKPREAA